MCCPSIKNFQFLYCGLLVIGFRPTTLPFTLSSSTHLIYLYLLITLLLFHYSFICFFALLVGLAGLQPITNYSVIKEMKSFHFFMEEASGARGPTKAKKGRRRKANPTPFSAGFPRPAAEKELVLFALLPPRFWLVGAAFHSLHKEGGCGNQQIIPSINHSIHN